MTKLPDNHELLKLHRDGLSDEEIAARFGASHQAVNKRLKDLGIYTRPHSAAAKALVEAAWPSSEGARRSKLSALAPGRSLYAYLRWRLNDPKLSPRQLTEARRFEARLRRDNVVLDLAAAEGAWVYRPREEHDGLMVIRWPAGRELPEGPHREALYLSPEAPAQ
ncbi:ImmA/IrrE family metallo-endopeptidase [Streptomyces sp. NPDC003444]